MRYPGGKNGAGTYQKIINMMPPHEVYIEPFLGSGAIMRHKRPASVNIGIDLDVEAVARVSADIATRSEDRSIIVENCDVRSRWPSLKEFVASEFTIHLARYRFCCGDALKALPNMRFDPQTLIYLDPPYLMETRKSGPLYRFEFSQDQHSEMLEIIRRLNCMVMVSGYWSKLYARQLKGWRTIHFAAITRGGSMAEEWFWMNFPAAGVLHDYRYLGNDFRAREWLNRRIRRWKSRLGRMDAMERQALLCAINDSPAPSP